MGTTTTIPFIDENVEHVGTTKLRGLNSAKLKSNMKTLVIQENDRPLAVLLNYEKYLIMQNQLISLLETIDVLSNQAEVAALKSGLEDMEAGRVRSIGEIRASLKKRQQ
jgi:PHD/YefM family antitoxin component YafN of YafNO toxin-antitoxin module